MQKIADFEVDVLGHFVYTINWILTNVGLVEVALPLPLDSTFTYDWPEGREDLAVGQRVLTARHGHAGHTRLPQYARGR